MQILDLELRALNGRIGLFQGGDLHADLKAFNEREFLTWRTAVLDYLGRGHEALVVFAGDYVHGRLPGDKFFDASILRPDVLAHLDNYAALMAERVGGLIAPLVHAGAAVVCLKGNHDAYLKEVDVARMVAERAGAIYGGSEALMRVTARDQYGKARVKTVYAAHGAGSGSTPGNRLNKARGSVFIADADAYLFGHIHNAVIHIDSLPYIKPTGTAHLSVRERLYSYASSFVDSRSEGVMDYPNAHSLPAVNTAKMAFEMDTWNDKFLPSRLV